MPFWKRFWASTAGVRGYADIAEYSGKTEGVGYMALLLLLLSVAPAFKITQFTKSILEMDAFTEVLRQQPADLRAFSRYSAFPPVYA